LAEEKGHDLVDLACVHKGAVDPGDASSLGHSNQIGALLCDVDLSDGHLATEWG